MPIRERFGPAQLISQVPTLYFLSTEPNTSTRQPRGHPLTLTTTARNGNKTVTTNATILSQFCHYLGSILSQSYGPTFGTFPAQCILWPPISQSIV